MNEANMIVCMGVSGSGKSTVGLSLANTLNWSFVEADDFHPMENKQQMALGRALTDEQRAPWMRAVCAHLNELAEENNSIVLAHSALRRDHRHQLRDCGFNTRFVHLTGPENVIEVRLAHRRGHYMPPTLLQSQIRTLQDTDEEDDVFKVDVPPPPDAVLQAALSKLDGFITASVQP